MPEETFPDELMIAYFRCMAEGCEGEGLHVLYEDEEERPFRSCDDCSHLMEMQGQPMIYRRVQEK
ncbi:MAG: hypothetical protein KJ709_09700 [Nanoarchaeota archaeon]|nr:hypothetical protein [Nanoarchaeota archaeon]